MTTQWYAEKLPSGAFQAILASTIVEKLFSGLADQAAPGAGSSVVRTEFARRAYAVRSRMNHAHELSHVLLNDISRTEPDYFEIPPGIGKTALLTWCNARTGAGLGTTSIVATITESNTACRVREALYRGLHAQASVLGGSTTPECVVGQGSRWSSGLATRVVVRAFARLLSKSRLTDGHMGTRFLAAIRCNFARPASPQGMPEPTEPPGQIVTGLRRPARGPNSSRTYVNVVHGVAIA